MKPTTIPFGQDFKLGVVVTHPTTGEPATPTAISCEVYDGSGAAVTSGTCSEIAGKPGWYTVTVLVEDASETPPGSYFNVFVTATVAGLTSSACVASVIVGPAVIYSTVRADAGNAAATFRTWLVGYPDDAFKDCLFLFTSGALVAQVKKVAAYNGTTGVLTMSGAFTAAPSADDRFVIVNQ